MKILTTLKRLFIDNVLNNRSNSVEEGEIESDVEALNPLVSVTKIDPKEIPEVSNKFLMRDRESSNRYEQDDDKKDRGFGWSKKSIPRSSSGKILKGRGNFRFRRDSRSRSRSATPKHWKQAQSKTIKWNEFEKMEKEKKVRDDEMKRRADDRRRRHEALSRGDGKKSFFELSQAIPETTEHSSKATVETDNDKKAGSVDLNALDYEESDGEKESVLKIEKNGKSKNDKVMKSRSRSRSHKRRSRSKSARRSLDRRDRQDRSTYHTSKNGRDETRSKMRVNRWDNDRKERVRHSPERPRRSRSNRSKSRDR